MFGLRLPELIVIALVVVPTALDVVGAWKVVVKAGYSGWWTLICFVPYLNFIMLFVFGRADWPILKRLRELRGGEIPPGAFMRG